MSEIESIRQVTSFSNIGLLARALKRMYERARISIRPDTDLSKTIDAGLALGEWWERGHPEPAPKEIFPKAICLLRLADNAVLLDDKGKRRCLRDLAKGSMMYWNNVQSKAKDTEWELNVWAHLKEAGFATSFLEPDLQILIDNKPMGVACKKAYSLRNADKQISKAAKQIEMSGMPGIVALSLDSLIQPDVDVAMLLVETAKEAEDKLQNAIDQFRVLKERRVLSRYFRGSRIAGFILSAQAFTTVKNEGNLSYHVQQSLVWTGNEVSDELRQKLRTIHDRIKGAAVPRGKVLAAAESILAGPISG